MILGTFSVTFAFSVDHARNVNYKAVAGLIGACEAAGSVPQP